MPIKGGRRDVWGQCLGWGAQATSRRYEDLVAIRGFCKPDAEQADRVSSEAIKSPSLQPYGWQAVRKPPPNDGRTRGQPWDPRTVQDVTIMLEKRRGLLHEVSHHRSWREGFQVADWLVIWPNAGPCHCRARVPNLHVYSSSQGNTVGRSPRPTGSCFKGVPLEGCHGRSSQNRRTPYA